MVRYLIGSVRMREIKMTENLNLIYEEISEKLKRSGYKLTPQREVTVETLIESNNELLTAEEIFIKVKSKNPSIGLATVYRTLDMLHELEIVKKIPFRDGMSRFDLVKTSNEHQPYYLLCQSCGQIEEIKEPILEDAAKRIEQEYRFKIVTHHLTFHGICKNCLDREEHSSGE